MSGYRLAPTRPTPEMVEAAKDAYMASGDMDLAIRVAVLAAPEMEAAVARPALDKYQPCGCVICTCEHETQCQGCGARHCGTHPMAQFPEPSYLPALRTSRQSEGVGCAVAAIEYAININTEEGLDFLRYWFYGDFDVLRRSWDNIPDQVFIGADPLFNSGNSQ